MIIKTDLIEKVMNEIAPKYFDADELSSVTKSRLGLFGIVSETMGTIFENATINNVIKAKERLSITSSRSTLLQEASAYPELVIPNAMPARISLFLGIPTRYLMERHRPESDLIEFVLDADTIIRISNIDFLMDYPLRITGRMNSGRFAYSAQYLISNDNPLSNILNPYLISSMRMIDNEEYVMVNLSVSQKTKEYQYYNIIETDIIELNGIDFDYSGQLAYFNIYYRSADSDEYTLVDKVNYFSKVVLSDRYIYYDDTNPGKIRLFIPESFGMEFNSELRLDIYTTIGSKGNFSYNSGSIEVLPQSYEDRYDYSGSYFSPIVISDSTGGSDSLTTEKIRDMVIDYKSSLRGVDTENDLNSFFRSVDTVNNMIFIKKRIDVFEKQYAAFMILRDDVGRIIPTNTLNITLTEEDVDFHYIQTMRRVIKPDAAYSLKPGEKFELIRNTNPLTDEYIKQVEEDPSMFLFGTPYLIVINEEPPSVSYYLNSVDRDSTMVIDYSNDDSPLQFIINKINVRRNAIIGEDSYKITSNLVPASDLPQGIVDEDGNILDPTKIKAYGYVYSDESEDTVVGYFPMNIVSYNVDDGYFRMEGELKTDEYITIDDKLRIVESVIFNGETDPSDYITNINDIKIGIGVYFKDDDFTDKGEYSDIIPGMENYGLTDVYTNNLDKTLFMIDMSRILRTVVNFVPEEEDEISFHIKQLPVVRYSVLKDQIGRISEVLANTSDTISGMLNLIRNNSSIDYKFYATYGRSRYFTMENTDVYLDKLNIDLSFKVRVHAHRTDVGLINDIKSFIQPLIEDINTLEGNRSVYFSNIITQVENMFKYTQDRILSFELMKVNDYPILYQSIVNNTKSMEMMTKEEMLEYVPEFVKLDLDKISIEIIPV